MINKSNIAIAALITVVGLSSVSSAEFKGDLEMGATYVGIDHQSARLSDYRGIKGNDTYFLGNMDLSYADKGYYLDLIGKNLGIDTRDVRLEGGRYGSYKYFLEYNQTPKFISLNSNTIFNGAGSGNLTLPSGYNRLNITHPTDNVAQATVGSILTELANNGGGPHSIDLKLERRSTGAGFTMTSFKGAVDFSMSFKREEKDGVKSIGAVVQQGALSGAGYRNTVILPEPVDYITDEFKASVAYTGEKGQLELEYLLSQFNNETESLRWNNPYYYGAPNPQISLPPDNRYQRISLSGGYNLPRNTRLSMVAEYGIMSQDQNFLPYHADPAATYTALPMESAKAEIETKLLNVNLSSRPVSAVNLSARYRHYDTVNMTRIGLFTYPPADGETPPATYIPTTNKNRVNDPFAYSQDKGSVDISYRLARNTNVKIGYDRDEVGREHREQARTKEDIYRLGLNTNQSSVSLGANYSRGARRGDVDYNGAAILDAHPDVVPPAFVNHPDLRKFDVADRDREKYDCYANLIVAKNASVGISLVNSYDLYPDTKLGLLNSDYRSYTVNAAYSPTNEIGLNLYYTYDTSSSRQFGRVMSTVSNAYDANKDWTSTNRDYMDTIGVNANISFMRGAMTIVPDYTYARSRTTIDIWARDTSATTGVGTIIPLPDLLAERHTVSLSGKYKVTSNVTLRANYLYETYRSADWSTDGLTLNNTASLPNDKPLIPLSGSEANYVANAGSISMIYKW